MVKKTAKLKAGIKPSIAKNKKSVGERVATSKKLSADLFSAKGVKVGKFSLPSQLFGQKPNKILLAQAVRVYLSNQRQARAKTKSRGEVITSKRKIYRQKGTGGARHGSRNAPIFVGGGIAHGPHGVENYSLSMSKKMGKKALISALSARGEQQQVLVLDMDKVETKTGIVAKVLFKITDNRKLTFVYAKKELYRALRNIADVNSVYVGNLTAYDALIGKSLLMTPLSIEELSTRILK